jgi:hypothetical protein
MGLGVKSQQRYETFVRIKALKIGERRMEKGKRVLIQRNAKKILLLSPFFLVPFSRISC